MAAVPPTGGAAAGDPGPADEPEQWPNLRMCCVRGCPRMGTISVDVKAEAPVYVCVPCYERGRPCCSSQHHWVWKVLFPDDQPLCGPCRAANIRVRFEDDEAVTYEWIADHRLRRLEDRIRRDNPAASPAIVVVAGVHHMPAAAAPGLSLCIDEFASHPEGYILGPAACAEGGVFELFEEGRAVHVSSLDAEGLQSLRLRYRSSILAVAHKIPEVTPSTIGEWPYVRFRVAPNLRIEQAKRNAVMAFGFMHGHLHCWHMQRTAATGTQFKDSSVIQGQSLDSQIQFLVNACRKANVFVGSVIDKLAMPNGHNLLTAAIAEGDDAAIKTLLEHGANPNHLTCDGSVWELATLFGKQALVAPYLDEADKVAAVIDSSAAEQGAAAGAIADAVATPAASGKVSIHIGFDSNPDIVTRDTGTGSGWSFKFSDFEVHLTASSNKKQEAASLELDRGESEYVANLVMTKTALPATPDKAISVSTKLKIPETAPLASPKGASTEGVTSPKLSATGTFIPPIALRFVYPDEGKTDVPVAVNQGSFGTMFKGIYKERKAGKVLPEVMVAIKPVALLVDEKSEPVDEGLQQLLSMGRAGHRGLVHFIGWTRPSAAIKAVLDSQFGALSIGKQWVLLVMRLYESTLAEAVGLTSQEVMQVARDVACGLQRLHSEGRVVQDLRPQSVLVGHDDSSSAPIAAIADLSAATHIFPDFTAASAVGDPSVFSKPAAPSPAADIYSFGKLLEFMSVAAFDPLISRCTGPQHARPNAAQVVAELERFVVEG